LWLRVGSRRLSGSGGWGGVLGDSFFGAGRGAFMCVTWLGWWLPASAGRTRSRSGLGSRASVLLRGRLRNCSSAPRSFFFPPSLPRRPDPLRGFPPGVFGPLPIAARLCPLVAPSRYSGLAPQHFPRGLSWSGGCFWGRAWRSASPAGLALLLGRGGAMVRLFPPPGPASRREFFVRVFPHGGAARPAAPARSLDVILPFGPCALGRLATDMQRAAVGPAACWLLPLHVSPPPAGCVPFCASARVFLSVLSAVSSLDSSHVLFSSGSPGAPDPACLCRCLGVGSSFSPSFTGPLFAYSVFRLYSGNVPPPPLLTARGLFLPRAVRVSCRRARTSASALGCDPLRPACARARDRCPALRGSAPASRPPRFPFAGRYRRPCAPRPAGSPALRHARAPPPRALPGAPGDPPSASGALAHATPLFSRRDTPCGPGGYCALSPGSRRGRSATGAPRTPRVRLARVTALSCPPASSVALWVLLWLRLVPVASAAGSPSSRGRATLPTCWVCVRSLRDSCGVCGDGRLARRRVLACRLSCVRAHLRALLLSRWVGLRLLAPRVPPALSRLALDLRAELVWPVSLLRSGPRGPAWGPPLRPRL